MKTFTEKELDFIFYVLNNYEINTNQSPTEQAKDKKLQLSIIKKLTE